MIQDTRQMPRRGRSVRSFTARQALVAATVLVSLGSAGSLLADTPAYWDVNGTAAGSGVTFATPDWVNGTISASGTWDGTITNWNTDSTGAGGGSLQADVGAGNTGVFSAGTDATGTYFVTAPNGGRLAAGGLSISQGNVIVAGLGNAAQGNGNDPSEIAIGSGTFNINVASGASLTLGYTQALMTMTGSATITKTGDGFFNNITDQLPAHVGNVFTGKWDLQAGTMGMFFGNTDLALGAPASFVADQLKISNNAVIETLQKNSGPSLNANEGVTFGAGGGTIFLAGARALDTNIPVSNNTIGTTTFGSRITGGAPGAEVPITIKSNVWNTTGANAGQSQGGLFSITADNSSSTAAPPLYAKWIVNTGELTPSSDGALGAVPNSYEPDAITLDLDPTGTNVGTEALVGGANIRVGASGKVSIAANRGIYLGSGGGGLDPAASATLTINSIISGPGQLRVMLAAPVSKVILKGADTYTGGTWITGAAGASSLGILQGDTTSLQGDIINDGNLDFDQAFVGTYAGNISSTVGAGTVAKSNTGTVVLAGTNTYAGGTTINGGVLIASTTAALPGYATSGKVIANSGGAVGGSAGGAGQWLSSDLDTLLNTTTFNTGSSFAINVDAANSFAYATNITQSIGFVKTGDGTLTLTGTNTYTGNTSVSAGVLAVSSLSNLGSANGSTISLGGGTLRTNAGFDIGVGQHVIDTGSGGTIDLAGNVVPTGWSCTINGSALSIQSTGGGGELYEAGAVNVNSLTVGPAARYNAYNDSALGTTQAVPTITLDGGTLGFSSSFTMAARAMTITANGATITTQGRFGAGTIHPQTVIDPGTLQGSGTLTHRGQGTFVLQGDTSGFTGGINVIADTLPNNMVGGTLQLQTNLLKAPSVNVNGSGSMLELAAGDGSNRILRAGAVSVSGGGQINLHDNKLITNSAIGSFNGTSYTGVTGLVASGRNGGTWNGSGIITSETQASTSILTTLGVATGAQAKGLAPGATAVWAGQTISDTSTLVMYTYAGDANLDGRINGDDYFAIDSHVNSAGASGYANGDFNYDGRINGDDYFIIDSNINQQSLGVFSTSAGVSSAHLSGVSAVPEPASIGLLGIAGLGLLRRRRRNS